MKIPILVLAGMLSLATLAQAGPRPKMTPPAKSSLLSTDEQFCEDLGKFSLEVGMARNRGISQFAMLRNVRTIGAKHGSTPDTQALYDKIVRLAYRNQAMSPIGLQQLTENVCVESPRTSTTTTRTERPVLRRGTLWHAHHKSNMWRTTSPTYGMPIMP